MSILDIMNKLFVSGAMKSKIIVSKKIYQELLLNEHFVRYDPLRGTGSKNWGGGALRGIFYGVEVYIK